MREDGAKEWDLPRLHRRPDDDDSSDEDSSDEDRSGGDSSDEDSSDEDSSDSADSSNGSALGTTSNLSSSAVAGARGGGSSSLHVELGWFIVFPLELSENKPLEVAKIVSVDLSAGNGGEVTVHWYTPVSNKKCSRAKYGRGVWSADFMMENNKRVPDLGTESVHSACYTFPVLNKSQKLPFGVWAAVESCVPTDDASLTGGGSEDDSGKEDDGVDDESEEEEEDDDDESEVVDEEREGGGEGGKGSASLEPRHSPAAEFALAPVPAITAASTTGVSLHAPRQAPNPNVRLTLAHYRPRRRRQQDNDGGEVNKEIEDTDRDVEVGGGGGAGGSERSASLMSPSASPKTSPAATGPPISAVRTIDASPPAPPPASNVRLTLAHFRPRRGQQQL